VTNSYQGERTTVRRLAQRGVYDRETIHRILDEGLLCHVGFMDQGLPVVIPTIYVRLGDCICVHGSPASRMLRVLGERARACVAVTLVDGLVLARSAFHHSVNYRSVVAFGVAEPVDEPKRKNEILFALSEHLIRGRWAEARQPSAEELRRTRVLSIRIQEASAKIRTGPPLDEEEDYALPVWAGILPLHLQAGNPIADPRLQPGIAVPHYAAHYPGPGAISSDS
jgi:uncharacterized protein